MSLTVRSLQGLFSFPQPALIPRSASRAAMEPEQCYTIDLNNTAKWECPTYYSTAKTCLPGTANATACDAFCDSLSSGLVKTELTACTEKLCGGPKSEDYKESIKSLESYVEEMTDMCGTHSTERQASSTEAEKDEDSSALRLTGGWKAAVMVGLMVGGLVAGL
ncbi:hypothetical protein BJ508DRAFT_417389 [Ascobolus immersus RN42]|uniref:Uncharacterized protein n=1 Tax=Ascobolus immersus RN42 TaxID=1160509 RepID=A0A3N4HST8_ASCIM|nr:hypothetical protein BJ508DRAFT_417389 [Ascobolus immersus RN42]